MSTSGRSHKNHTKKFVSSSRENHLVSATGTPTGSEIDDARRGDFATFRDLLLVARGERLELQTPPRSRTRNPLKRSNGKFNENSSSQHSSTDTPGEAEMTAGKQRSGTCDTRSSCSEGKSPPRLLLSPPARPSRDSKFYQIDSKDPCIRRNIDRLAVQTTRRMGGKGQKRNNTAKTWRHAAKRAKVESAVGARRHRSPKKRRIVKRKMLLSSAPRVSHIAKDFLSVLA
mmetsp:Transcript_14823/g.30056  ORF Transcript_14823/g.30056 Transcript_14823/m.30056 type:complete len:229 (-) Transcript_14823:159-845(-)|eukprot:CAMPEP_0167826850 /NCGR_PEP_ID=MMETSP0112_2-20121227/10315_1 /TAXON_ID=91324 /ORGANISM="Lotharella globosa, Strain CCCM811" /LENGTH=228 /DNA_ID=CAMNT_0007729443 /DNA_START=131 /DNA_END=817 /DNA_ORIENTATION=+